MADSSVTDVERAGDGRTMESLLREACLGSPEAIGRVLEACRTVLLLVARERLSPDLQSKGSASDLVQDSFLEAHRDFGQFRGQSRDDLVVWLRGILLHNLADFQERFRTTGKRSIEREAPLDRMGGRTAGSDQLPGPVSTPSSLAQRDEREHAVREAIARLPAEYRQVILLRHFDHLAFADIASTMDRSPDAVRKLWRRAIGRLEFELKGLP